jgi:hypothetical protein
LRDDKRRLRVLRLCRGDARKIRRVGFVTVRLLGVLSHHVPPWLVLTACDATPQTLPSRFRSQSSREVQGSRKEDIVPKAPVLKDLDVYKYILRCFFSQRYVKTASDLSLSYAALTSWW